MSSSANLTFDDGEEITLEEWQAFADSHGLGFNPHVVGQTTFRHPELHIAVQFGERGFCPEPGSDGRIDFSQCTPPAEARRIIFTTTWMSSAVPDVAELAVAAWQRFGGALNADPEVRQYIRAGKP